jgi:catechol 2,3-dioxygenase-like lactoylglutathione lyase family enzyme/ketosteroid isomerase-like protein
MRAGDELARLERAWLEAVQRRDLPALERLLGEEFTLTTGRPGAEVRTRTEYLEVTRDAYVVESFAFDELETHVHADAAVVRSRYRQRGRMGAEDRTQSFLMTDVWFRRDGRWQAVARHLSPLGPSGVRPFRLDHCVIAVSDWGRSNTFYRDVLGAEIDQKSERFGHYRFGEWQLNVHGPGFEGLNAAKPVEPGNSDLCFVWPERIEEALEHLARHGIAVVEGPGERDSFARGRGRSVYFRDPDGSLLEFVAYEGG